MMKTLLDFIPNRFLIAGVCIIVSSLNFFLSKYMIDNNMGEIQQHFDILHEEILSMPIKSFHNDGKGVGTYPDLDMDRLVDMKYMLYDTLRSLDEVFFQYGPKVRYDDNLYYCTPVFETRDGTDVRRTEVDKICEKIYKDAGFGITIELPEDILLNYNYHKLKKLPSDNT